jgi:hypothetical protein
LVLQRVFKKNKLEQGNTKKVWASMPYCLLA